MGGGISSTIAAAGENYAKKMFFAQIFGIFKNSYDKREGKQLFVLADFSRRIKECFGIVRQFSEGEKKISSIPDFGKIGI